MAYNMLTQFNDHGCGVFSVMNAMRYRFEIYPLRYQYKQIEEELDTDLEYGTEEWPMVQKLREDFYVSIVRSFDKKRMDKWLDKGDDYQVIVLYPWAFPEEGPKELHYCNVTDKYPSCYVGGNFYSSRMGFRHWVHKSFIDKWFDHEDTSVIYLRSRGIA